MRTFTQADFARWGKAGGVKAAKGKSKKWLIERARKAGSAKRKNGKR